MRPYSEEFNALLRDLRDACRATPPVWTGPLRRMLPASLDDPEFDELAAALATRVLGIPVLASPGMASSRMPKTAFGKALRAWRKKRGLTEAELARMCGISQGYVSQLEDKKLPRVVLFERLVQALGLNAEEHVELIKAAASNDPYDVASRHPYRAAALVFLACDADAEGCARIWQDNFVEPEPAPDNG